jgi:cell division protein FtsW
VASKSPARRVVVPTARGRVELVDEPGSLRRTDGWLLIVIAALCAFGLVMVYSASEALGYNLYGNANYYFERQSLGLGLGVVGMLVALRFDYHRLQSLARPLAMVCAAMLVLVLIPHVGTDRYGAYRWFSLGPISVQPSAIATLVAIVAFTHWLTERRTEVRTWRGVRDYAVLLLGLLALILMERDMGSTIVVAVVALMLLTLGGARKRHLVLVLGTLVLLAFIMVKVEPYRVARALNFGPNCTDILNTCWQSTQAQYALGSGGLTGVGLGNSIQKFQWLPEAHTDFIFAIIGEELGIAGTLSVLTAFTFLAWRGVRASLRAPDTFGALLAGGITAWVTVQAIINIAAVTELIPTTGIPLPFISYGGTSLAMTMVAMGILCNVSAQGRRNGGMARRAHTDRRGRDWGASDPGARRGRGAAAVGSG